jgi:hypothetical protein
LHFEHFARSDALLIFTGITIDFRFSSHSIAVSICSEKTIFGRPAERSRFLSIVQIWIRNWLVRSINISSMNIGEGIRNSTKNRSWLICWRRKGFGEWCANAGTAALQWLASEYFESIYERKMFRCRKIWRFHRIHNTIC